MTAQSSNCVLVAAGKYHDIDYARCELLKLLGNDTRTRTRVFENYENVEALNAARLLITYTCDVMPSASAQNALLDWLKSGGRWLALHGTNAILERSADGLWHTPRKAPLFMQALGSQFLSHPPIQAYTVENTSPEHPLVSGIGAFEVTDELYHMEIHEPIERLLECQCHEIGRGFSEGDAAIGRHPVLYRKMHGEGEVIYLTLGHCRGHFDMQPLMDYWPTLDRGAWEIPEYVQLVSRSIAWLLERH